MTPNNKTTVTIVMPDSTCTVEQDDTITFEEVINMVKNCLLGSGFHPDLVKEYFDEQ